MSASRGSRPFARQICPIRLTTLSRTVLKACSSDCLRRHNGVSRVLYAAAKDWSSILIDS